MTAEAGTVRPALFFIFLPERKMQSQWIGTGPVLCAAWREPMRDAKAGNQ